MSGVQVDAAKGIVAALTGPTFSIAITPRRSYGDLDFKTASETTVTVDVVPYMVQRIGLASRGLSDYLTVTTIAVKYKFKRTEQAADNTIAVATIDPYMDLLQEIHDFFSQSPANPSGRRLTAYPEAAWEELPRLPFGEEPAILGPYQEPLANRIFVGVTRIAYRFTRTAG